MSAHQLTQKMVMPALSLFLPMVDVEVMLVIAALRPVSGNSTSALQKAPPKLFKPE
jgi:hypothetical protein